MVIHKLTVDHGLSLDVIQDIKWLIYTLIVNERQDSIKQISTALLLLHNLVFFFMYFILLENYNSNNIGLFTRTKVDFT